MPAEKLKALMSKKHVVVTACPDPPLKFDEEGLQTLAPMHLPVSLQGQRQHLPIILSTEVF